MLNLKKDESAILNLEKNNNNIVSIGLGWDTRADLDVHCVLRDELGNLMSEVYYGNKIARGVSLSGDNVTGEGDGDDEIIYVNLDKLDLGVGILSVYVNIYSRASSFDQIDDGFIRIYDDNKEYAASVLDIAEIKEHRAVHFADIKIIRPGKEEDNQIPSFDFKVIMHGGEIHNLMNSYKKIVAPKRKKIFGIF